MDVVLFNIFIVIWKIELSAQLSNLRMTPCWVELETLEALQGMPRIQNDRDRLEKWTAINQMKYNKDKCKFLHVGWHN